MGNRFIRENIGSDNLPYNVVIITNSTDPHSAISPPEANSLSINSSSIGLTYITPTSGAVLNLGVSKAGYLQNDFIQDVNICSNNAEDAKVITYKNLSTSMNALPLLSGTPDLRTGVTAADASPITIYSSSSSGTRYEVKARILATSGSSATYTISWTEGGVAQTVALTITAVDTEVHDNFVVAPDSGTNITAQITALTSSTVNVDAIVSVLG